MAQEEEVSAPAPGIPRLVQRAASWDGNGCSWRGRRTRPLLPEGQMAVPAGRQAALRLHCAAASMRARAAAPAGRSSPALLPAPPHVPPPCRYELGRQAAMTKLSSNVCVRRVRVRGGNSKFRALRLDHGNFSWGSEVGRTACLLAWLCSLRSMHVPVRIWMQRWMLGMPARPRATAAAEPQWRTFDGAVHPAARAAAARAAAATAAAVAPLTLSACAPPPGPCPRCWRCRP